MLRRLSTPAVLRSVRFNSTASHMFTPNDGIGFFNEEKGYSQEDIDAIPKRRQVSNIPKINVEMLSPEDVADVLISPDFNDAFITCLAKNSPFSGDKSYKVVPKELKIDPLTVPLLFSDITKRYIEVYNDQTIVLKPFPDAFQLPTLSKSVALKLKEEVEKEHTDDILTVDSLNRLAQRLKVFETTRLQSIGEYQPQSSSNTISFEDFIIYFLSDLSHVSLPQHQAILRIMEDNISLITIEGLRRIVETVVQSLNHVEDPQVFEVYGTFILEHVISNYPFILSQFQPIVLDDLVKLFTKTSDPQGARKALKTLVSKSKIVPRASTLEQYLIWYNQLWKNRVRFIRDNSFLKSVFFTIDLTPLIAKSILNTVSTVFELDHFLKLVAKKNNQGILTDISCDIFLKCIKLQRGSTRQALKVTQLLVSLHKQGVKISEEAKDVLIKFYEEKGLLKNVDFVKSL